MVIDDGSSANICIDDIRSAQLNRYKYRIIYTDKDTYLTKDPLFVPQEKESLWEFI